MYPRDFWFYRRFQSSFEIIESKGLVFKRKNQFVFLSIFHFGIEIVMLCSIDTFVTTDQWQI